MSLVIRKEEERGKGREKEKEKEGRRGGVKANKALGRCVWVPPGLRSMH